MRHGNKSGIQHGPRLGTIAAVAVLAGALLAGPAWGIDAGSCKGTVYLTLDTGNMQPAEDMAAVLNKHQVKATFFLANEKTFRGDTTLDPAWAAVWKARAREGHAFGSHTWRHWYFRQDLGRDNVSFVPWGAKAGDTLDQAGVCAELRRSEDAFKAMTGRGFDGLWRAPGGKLTPNVTRFAESCGYRHVGWTPAGFSGDELPSEKFPSGQLIAKQLSSIRDGDILVWHLGIWSRKDPLFKHFDELIGGLQAKGLCFARITDHPQWRK
jgi:peptidoglycan/xylan/chitin deacetylase (PgdA/CDA1 family)